MGSVMAPMDADPLRSFAASPASHADTDRTYS